MTRAQLKARQSQRVVGTVAFSLRERRQSYEISRKITRRTRHACVRQHRQLGITFERTVIERSGSADKDQEHREIYKPSRLSADQPEMRSTKQILADRRGSPSENPPDKPDIVDP